MREKYSLSCATSASGSPRSVIAVKPRMSENSTLIVRRLPPELGERRVLQHLVEDVLRDVAREQPLDLALLAALDEVLPGEPADAGEGHGRERLDQRQPEPAIEGGEGGAADRRRDDHRSRRAVP